MGVLKSGLILRFLVLALMWWVLTGGTTDSWFLGIPCVAFAAWVSTRLSDSHSAVRVRAVLAFVPFFLWRSLVGSVDVARRSLSPQLDLNPDLISYDLRISHPDARIFMTGVVGLLPGTLGAELNGNRLVVHAMDAYVGLVAELQILEAHVAALFGCDLEGG